MYSQQYRSRRASRRHSNTSACRKQTGGEGVRGGSAVGQPTSRIFASYRWSFDVYSRRVCTAMDSYIIIIIIRPRLAPGGASQPEDGRQPPEGHGNDPATDQPARHVRTDATAPTRRQRRPPSPAPHPQHGPRMEHATHGASTTDQRHPDADQRPPPHSTRPRHTRESGAYRHRKVGPRWVLLYRSRWHSVC